MPLVNSTAQASILWALHPDAYPDRCTLYDGVGNQSTLLDTDLIVVAPSYDSKIDSHWIRSCCKFTAGNLRQDGLVYAVLPVKWRRALKAELVAAEFVVDDMFLHLPSTAISRYMVSLSGSAGEYAIRTLMHRAPFVRNVLAKAAQTHIAAGVAGMLPTTGFVARRSEGRGAFDWVPCSRTDRSIIIEKAWRTADDRVVLHVLSNGRLSMIARAAWSNPTRERLRKHAAGLEHVASTVCDAGVRVPALISMREDQNVTMLAETPLEGERLVSLLKSRRGSVLDVIQQLGHFLARWNLTSRSKKSRDEESIAATILAAETLSGRLQDGPNYVAHVRSLAATVRSSGTTVAAHNDLTMWNILYSDGRLGIIDWEHGTVHGLALTDFFYAAADAAAAADGYRDRKSAFLACYQLNGAYSGAVRTACEHIMHEVDLSPAAAAFSFHACWLRHALNESQEGLVGHASPFFDILDEMARQPARLLPLQFTGLS